MRTVGALVVVGMLAVATGAAAQPTPPAAAPSATEHGSPSPTSRTITLRLAVDDAMRARPNWETTLRWIVAGVSGVYDRAFRIRWTVVDIVPWTLSPGTADRQQLLRGLKKLGRGSAEVILGVSGRKCTPASVSTSSPFSAQALLTPECEHPASTAGGPPASPTTMMEQQLSHELAHLFGAFHVEASRRSVMGGGAPGDFDGQTTRVITLLRAFDFGAGVSALDEGTRRAWSAIYAEGHARGEPNALALALRNRGLDFADAGQPDDALTQFREAIRIDPDAAPPYVDLGDTLLRQGQHLDAIRAFRRAIRNDPRLPSARLGLGAALDRQGRPKDALAEFREAVRLDPEGATTHQRLGAAYLTRNQPKEAVLELREALRLAPGSAAIHADLADALAAQGQSTEALAEAKKALDIDPALASAHEVRGRVFTQQGKRTEALAAFSEAVRLAPDQATAHHSFGTALSSQGRHDEALREFRDAVRLEPGNDLFHLSLGRALAQRGKVDEGVVELREAMRLNPTSPARVVLAETYVDARRYREAWDLVHESNATGQRVPPELVRKLSSRMPDPQRSTTPARETPVRETPVRETAEPSPPPAQVSAPSDGTRPPPDPLQPPYDPLRLPAEPPRPPR